MENNKTQHRQRSRFHSFPLSLSLLRTYSVKLFVDLSEFESIHRNHNSIASHFHYLSILLFKGALRSDLMPFLNHLNKWMNNFEVDGILARCICLSSNMFVYGLGFYYCCCLAFNRFWLAHCFALAVKLKLVWKKQSKLLSEWKCMFQK